VFFSDFTCELIDLQVTYLIVDDMHQNIPELTKDQYWDSTDFQLPYTEATIHYQKEAVLGSAADIEFVKYIHLYSPYGSNKNNNK